MTFLLLFSCLSVPLSLYIYISVSFFLLQICSCTSYLKSALSPRAIEDGGGSSYLNDLIPSKEELDELFGGLVKDGHGLVEIFSRPPVDPNDPVIRISNQLKDLKAEKTKIDHMWEKAWQPIREWERGEPIGQSPSQSSHDDDATPSGDDHVTSGAEVESLASRSSSSLPSDESKSKVKVTQTRTGAGSGKVKKVSQVGVVSQKDSDKFSELEEEAYEVCVFYE